MLEDPAFGRIEYDKRLGCWFGSVPFGPEGQELVLTVYGEAPTESQRESLREFARRQSALTPTIAAELFKLYEPYVSEPVKGMPCPASATDMWKMVHLGGVDLGPDGSLIAAYHFREGLGWDDAMFEVGFENWKPVGKSLGD